MTDARGHPPRPTRAEWAVFAVSALAILGVLGILVAEWAIGPSGPPTFETDITEVRRAEGRFHVAVKVKNVGSQAAAEVRVRAELTLGAEVVEAEETIDFLAPGETTSVTFVFARDPNEGQLSVAVDAFREP